VASMRLTCLAMTLLLLLASTAVSTGEGTRELLWPDGAPGAKGDTDADKPTLTICLPDAEKAVGTAVVVCPGGGYGHLATGHEGHDIAEWFNRMGVAALILEYRHRGRGYGHPAPLKDAQRAIRTARARAAEFGAEPDRIGIMGFSAGGHLASTAATHFDAGNADADDPLERVGCRPDFAILCYPVIALDEPFTHRGSQRNLLGENPEPRLVESLSGEKQVTSQTPPTFLFHTDEDHVVPPENSVYFYLALKHAGVPAELHIYRQGRHGLGLARNTLGTANWPEQCQAWLNSMELLDKKP